VSATATGGGPDPRALVDYAGSLDCVHCGLCLNSCPTYRLTGAESSSPRGRVHLMRSVAEGELPPDAGYAEELDFCLLCRHCESVCPSGVRFGALMEHARSALEPARRRGLGSRLARFVGFRVLLPRPALLSLAATLGRFTQRTGLLRAVARLLGARGRSLAAMPAIPPGSERRRPPPSTPAIGAPHGAVLVLEGCVMPELHGRVQRSTARVLAHAGYEVRRCDERFCCGSLHAHNGDLAGARALGRRAIEAYERAGADLPVVVDSAGCGAHMKEWGQLFAGDEAWDARARACAARVVDFSEALSREPARARLAQALARGPGAPGLGTVAYDDPCHLCHAQGIRREPRALLDLVPGIARVEMRDAEACCGSAGIYALARPEDSAAVLAPKLESLRASGARTLVTANPGCHVQWESGVAREGLAVRVVHLAEALDAALPRG